jgi:hypothetical protein
MVTAFKYSDTSRESWGWNGMARSQEQGTHLCLVTALHLSQGSLTSHSPVVPATATACHHIPEPWVMAPDPGPARPVRGVTGRQQSAREPAWNPTQQAGHPGSHMACGAHSSACSPRTLGRPCTRLRPRGPGFPEAAFYGGA